MLEKLTEDFRESHRVLTHLIREIADRGKGVAESTVGEVMDERFPGKDKEVDSFLEDVNEGESSQARLGGGMGRVEVKKLEMPIFDGKDPDGWFFRAEHFFQFHQLSDNEKLKVALISFEGGALHWFRWANNRQKFRSWDDLKARLFARFRLNQDGNLCARFLAVKQVASVAEYRRTFEELSAPLSQLPEVVLLNTFANGLNPLIQKEVQCLRPKGLDEMMELAQLIEERLELSPWDVKPSRWKEQREVTRVKEVLSDKPRSITVSERSAVFERPAGPVGRRGNFKRLTDAEIKMRREKGLCFRCEEKFSVGHRCKNKALQLLFVSEDNAEASETEPEEEENLVTVDEKVELSLNSVIGLQTPGTMKVKGRVDGQEVVV